MHYKGLPIMAGDNKVLIGCAENQRKGRTSKSLWEQFGMPEKAVARKIVDTLAIWAADGPARLFIGRGLVALEQGKAHAIIQGDKAALCLPYGRGVYTVRLKAGKVIVA